MANYWTAFEWGAYLKKTSKLTLAEHGAYLLLMAEYYQTGKPLPANAEILLRVCRAFADHEKAAVLAVLSEFFVLDGDGYRNPRIDEELQKAAQISEKRRDAGKKGAVTTNGKRAANGAANERQMPTQLQSQLHNGSNTAQPLKRVLLEEAAENIYQLYPRKIAKADAIKAILKAIAREAKRIHIHGAIDYLCDRTQKFAQSPAGNDGDYVPYPATWFNGERYNDPDSAWLKTERKYGAPNQTRTQQRLNHNRAAITEALRAFNDGSEVVGPGGAGDTGGASDSGPLALLDGDACAVPGRSN